MMKLARRLNRLVVLAALIALAAFLYIGLQGEAIAAPSAQAIAEIQGIGANSAIQGRVSFTDSPHGLVVTATVTGAPQGQHGFHIHAQGSCAEAGNAAGGHFNPDQTPHGKLLVDGLTQAHAGDLGNILIGQDGVGELVQTLPGLAVNQGARGITDHAIILHERRDDFSQPTGNAGGRIGCGVIQDL